MHTAALNKQAALSSTTSTSWVERVERLMTAVSKLSAALSCIFLLATAMLVASQVVARLVGMQIPAADDFAAWAMAGTVFLALPYTLRQGAHIRVVLLLQILPGRLRKVCELAATLSTAALIGWAAWHCSEFVYDSYVHNELSQGVIAMPLWVPQLSMPLGMWGLFLLLVGRLLCVIRNSMWVEEDNG